MEMPVYLFTGFLESGKTTFIQEALEGSDFNMGERTLLILCEQGERELDPSSFFGKNVFIEVIENEEDLTTDYLKRIQDKHRPERVVVEYNGMWMLDTFYQNMPESWITYQEMLFVYSPTFLEYNKNMRTLVYDKLKSAELVVFNRFEEGEDKMEFHKIVRGANRRSQIIYEYEKDKVEFDDIKDPLPFDMDAPLIKIKDSDYAEWYRDINEEQDKYDGKTINVKCRTLVDGLDDDDTFVMGRHVMTCCVEDIQFGGLVCKWVESSSLIHGEWAVITADIVVEYHEMYGEPGPVLYVSSLQVCQPADPEVATFN